MKLFIVFKNNNVTLHSDKAVGNHLSLRQNLSATVHSIFVFNFEIENNA